MEKKNELTIYEKQARERIAFLISNHCEGSQQRFSEKTGLNKASVSQYVNGKNTPSNITARRIAEVFNVDPAWVMGFDVPMKSSPVMPMQSISGKTYYFSDETAAMAQELFDNPELRMLFDASKDSKASDLQMAADMLKRFKETNPDG